MIGEVNAIKNDGPPATVTHNIFNWPGDFEPSPEALTFVPQPQDMCTYCGFAFFQASQQNPAGAPSVFAYPPTDFNGLGGSLLVTLESNQRIAVVQFLAGNYSTTVFDNPPGSNILEGNSFVDCDVPTPTPTSTPTATLPLQLRLLQPPRQRLLQPPRQRLLQPPRQRLLQQLRQRLLQLLRLRLRQHRLRLRLRHQPRRRQPRAPRQASSSLKEIRRPMGR